MTTTRPPRAPNGLKARGSALWREVTAIYDLDPGEIQLLRELCRTVDRVEAIDAGLMESGLVVTGNRGQLPKASPLLQEQRETQRTMSRLIAELALPLPGEQVGRRRSPQQRHAARARWNRRTG